VLRFLEIRADKPLNGQIRRVSIAHRRAAARRSQHQMGTCLVCFMERASTPFVGARDSDDQGRHARRGLRQQPSSRHGMAV